MAVINGDDTDNKYPGPFDNSRADPLIGTAVVDTIHGNGGSDDILGGGSYDLLYGDDGNDEISGGASFDRLEGGAGNDYLRGGEGADTIIGGSGTDTLIFGARSHAEAPDNIGLSDSSSSDVGVLVMLGATNIRSGGTGKFGDAEGDTYEAIANVSGTEGGDEIHGTNGTILFVIGQPGKTNVVEGDNVLWGNGGNDKLYGNGGNDTLLGGADSDTLEGGSGNDNLLGEDGSDVLKGGSGADRISGGSGNDLVSYAGSSAGVSISLAGGTGHGGDAEGDVIVADGGTGISRDDFIENALGSSHDDTIAGSQFGNLIIGGDGSDRLSGQAGNDVLYGDNLLAGGSGSDILSGGAGSDRLVGGGGSDTADYATSTSGVGVNLAAGAAIGGDAAGDTFDGIENINGSKYADTLTGTVSSDNASFGTVLFGNDGADKLYGTTRADVLAGGTGIDVMEGKGGNDTYLVDSSGDAVVEANGGGTDTIYTTVSYTLAADTEVEILRADGLPFFPNPTTSVNLTGNGRANALIGNAGANTLNGGGGDDKLAGGLGNDTLTGLSGHDTFQFDTALGAKNVDHIQGFSVADDTISLDNAVFKGLANGAMKTESFKDITNSATLDANDRILYDHNQGRLYYDSDGSGSAAKVQFAIIDNHPTLTFHDFLIV